MKILTRFHRLIWIGLLVFVSSCTSIKLTVQNINTVEPAYTPSDSQKEKNLIPARSLLAEYFLINPGVADGIDMLPDLKDSVSSLVIQAIKKQLGYKI